MAPADDAEYGCMAEVENAEVAWGSCLPSLWAHLLPP